MSASSANGPTWKGNTPNPNLRPGLPGTRSSLLRKNCMRCRTTLRHTRRSPNFSTNGSKRYARTTRSTGGLPRPWPTRHCSMKAIRSGSPGRIRAAAPSITAMRRFTIQPTASRIRRCKRSPTIPSSVSTTARCPKPEFSASNTATPSSFPKD